MKKYQTYALTLCLAVLTFNNLNAQCIAGDCINGIGTYKWTSGATYTGQFQNGNRNGYGQYNFNNNDIYVGEWQNNERHGYGVYFYYKDPAGYKSYSGEWVGGLRSGIGIMLFVDESITPRFGIWKNNAFVNKYEDLGCLEGDCYQGYGIYVWNDGSRYEGNFKEGKRDGEGIYYYAKGSKYIGDQMNGERHGWGTYYYPSGGKYSGEWVKEVREGKGTMYSQGQIFQKGKFLKGEFIEEEKQLTDSKPPVIKIISPESVALRNSGPRIVVKERDVFIQGTVTDESGIEQVRANGVVTELTIIDKQTTRFSGTVSLSKGQNDFWIEATDKKGNTAKETFKIIYEPLTEGPITAVSKGEDSEKRTALLIGNAEYLGVPALRNPKNDAIAMASRLKEFGFEVELLTNVSEDQMITAIREYGKRLKLNGGIGLFYYAGHGLQVDGHNYLVPVNAKIEKTGDIELEAVNLKRVLNELEFADNRMNIVILDACRDNPYGDNVVRGGASPQGLGTTNAPKGTYIAYSTSPNKAASDGSGDHGLYTEMLLRVLENPQGIKIEDIFKQVRSYVMEESEELQIPWENSSITGDFFFKY